MRYLSLLGVAASYPESLNLRGGGREVQQFNSSMLSYTVNEFEARVGCLRPCLSKQTKGSSSLRFICKRS